MRSSFIRSFRKALRRFERLNHSLNSTCCKVATMAQCHVLLEIDEIKETTLVQLADNMRLDKSTLSRTVEGLVQLGLVERKPHPTDRRFILLRLTPAGEEICEKINNDADQIYLSAFKKVRRDGWNEIARSIETLADAMDVSGQTQEEKKLCCKPGKVKSPSGSSRTNHKS